MADRSGLKGNPASKRMTNPNRKGKYARAWEAAKRRKDARRQEQNDRAALNRARRADGEATPWERACARRAARRQGVGEAA